MDQFFASQTCLSGLHCQSCRDPKYIKLRQKWVDVYNKGGDINFICPYGRLWGYKGNEPPPKDAYTPKKGVRKLLHGAKGLVKAVTRRDRVSLDVLKARQETCNNCDKKTAMLKGITTKCSVCGCNLPAKQRIASERCPLGKWDKIKTIPLPVIN